MDHPITHFRHILVPIDFEASARRALEVAIDLAVQFDARLTIVHAWDIPSYAYVSIVYMPVDTWGMVERAATEQLAETLATVHKRLPRAESLLAKGSARDAVLASIPSTSCDLVVMGTHGRHGLGRVLLGSVAEAVVRASPVPVLTLRDEPVPVRADRAAQ